MHLRSQPDARELRRARRRARVTLPVTASNDDAAGGVRVTRGLTLERPRRARSRRR